MLTKNAAVQTQPMLATQQPMTGEYAVIMIDLDIPTDNPPETSTLLHWMQTGLSSASTPMQLNMSSGSTQAFLLQNTTNTPPLAPYLGPSPPPKIPLSHRYTQILVNHTGITSDGLQALMTAAANRSGFDALEVLTNAGLSNDVVAGNFYNVTNSGAVNGTSSSSSIGGSSSDSSGSASASGTVTGSGPIQAAAFSLSPHMGMVMLCLGVVGAVFVGL